MKYITNHRLIKIKLKSVLAHFIFKDIFPVTINIVFVICPQWKMQWSSHTSVCFSTKASVAALALELLSKQTSMMSLWSGVWSELRHEWWETPFTYRLSRDLR